MLHPSVVNVSDFRNFVHGVLSRYIARRLQRVCFGTAASLNLYDPWLREIGATAETCLIEAVPAKCTCLDDSKKDPNLVVFVGSLEIRKGVPLLLEAWPLVKLGQPDARLVIVGKGLLQASVDAFSQGRSDVELVVDPPRADIHRLLRRARVVVLLSQAVDGWREQVGLPIVEGLAHGCRIVSTADTGLSCWLASNGHYVVPDSSLPAVASAMGGSLSGTIGEPANLLSRLPAEDGRRAAERWLLNVWR
jgi:glycosyltransferase involved in cell wall biosynthesis